MTREERQQSLVNARRACLLLTEYAEDKTMLIILGEDHRESIASLLEEFGRLDGIERRQSKEGKKHGHLGKEYGHLGGRPKGVKKAKKKARA